MSTPTFPAVRFDGCHAEAMPVVLRVENAYLVVETRGGTMLERQPLDSAVISEPLDHAPRLVSLQSGATLQVPDADRGFAHALQEAGVRSSLAVRLQTWSPGVVIALAALVTLLAAAYFKGLPAAARWVAFVLPPRVEARMGDQLLAVLDRYYLRPSRLDEGRRTRIADRFARAAGATAPGIRYRLEFRSTDENDVRSARRSRPAGAPPEPGRHAVVNAMALPGGTIILLDGLVEFAGDEDAVLGVLGHELGHVAHKHSTRQILQSVGVGALASLLWGDFSSVAASVPAALAVLRYSRDFEREADEFSLVFLRAQDVSARPLYQFFTQVRALESRRGVAAIPDFMSSHPSTDERLERLRREIR